MLESSPPAAPSMEHVCPQDAVAVVGYPIGGDTISVTSGVESRIEVTSCVHGSTELLGVQIDAAVISGNSGKPAQCDHLRCVLTASWPAFVF